LIVQISNNALVIALTLYVLSFILFVIGVVGKKWSNRDPEAHVRRYSRTAFILACAGLASQLVFFGTRWSYTGHLPISNMFEFLSTLGMMVAIAFTVIYLIYRSPLLGMFATPVVVILIGYAAVFPWEAQPLIPALQSIWLYLHVSLAAIGEAFFAIGFAAGLMYLMRTVNFKEARWARRGVEFTVLSVLMVVGFIFIVFFFRGMGYEAQFATVETVRDEAGNELEMPSTVTYTLPPIAAPHDSEVMYMDSFLGMDKPLFETPGWMKGVNAGRKFNTVIWSVISGLILYGLLRLIARRPLGAAIQPALTDINPDDLDEISYRSIAIGFPIFTLGALIFAMIWAQAAWGRFWGWDPKEVWALIVWLFYSAYLHLRLSRGWLGAGSAWLAVIGFVIVMFTLVGVNLIIAGLHSYAGV